MKVILQRDCPQVSDKWWAAKRGIPSASNFDRILTATTCKPSSQAKGYIAELLADIACLNPKYFTQRGHPVNSYAVQQGVDREPESRRWLALETELVVEEVGLCLTDDLRLCCSPDGVIGLRLFNPDGKPVLPSEQAEPEGEISGIPFYAATCEGTLELKNPLAETHLLYLMDEGSLLKDYRVQTHGQLIVCRPKWGEIVSYAPPHMPLRIRFEADEYTAKLEAALQSFLCDFEAAKAKFLPQGAVA